MTFKKVSRTGILVRRERVRAGWSRRELAQRAGVRYETILRIETGDVRSHMATLRRLAEALEVTPADLSGEVAA